MIGYTRRCLAVLVLLAGALAVLPYHAEASPAVGKPAPEFTGIDSTGKSHRLGDLRGKVVVLEWTNHDCPFVSKHYRSSNMQRTQKDVTDSGAVWLSVISSAPGLQGHVTGPEADALTRSRDAHPSAVLLDPKGDIGRLYRAAVTPHIFIVDEGGTLAYQGAIDDIASWDEADVPKATNYVRQVLAQLKAGLQVKPGVTRPYGCSVKYGS
jgi:hypothetical protein